MNLRIVCENGREMAQKLPLCVVCLAGGVMRDNVVQVVAVLPQGAETTCLNRYSSPPGRADFPQGCPSRFFCFKTNNNHVRQGFAESRPPIKQGFIDRRKPAMSDGVSSLSERGEAQCGRSFIEQPPWLYFPVLRRVATPASNRRSWARVRARRPLSCLTATLSLARLSARRSTSPFVRNTQHAANASRLKPEPGIRRGVAQRINDMGASRKPVTLGFSRDALLAAGACLARPLSKKPKSKITAGASCGDFFVATVARGIPSQPRTSRRDSTCSKRS